VASQPINGLSVTKGGVTFTFADLAGAIYNSPGPGQETYVMDPSIVGNSGGEVVSVLFSQAFNEVQFGLALNTNSPVASMATVSLFNSGSLVLTTTFASSRSDSFTEGLFVYVGAPVDSIKITPNSIDASAFALDNLGVGVPEPSTFFLAGAGLAIAATLSRRRKSV
jgi:hypothetical protein